MIPRIFPPRRDKNTSFNKLFNYITKGLRENGVDFDEFGFGCLTQYITTETVPDLSLVKVEKTLAVEIGNLSSIEQAAPEMYSVAQKNLRVEDPVLHYMISWPENERPPVRDMLAAARETLEALGLIEHQYVIAIHVNTDNLHAHVEVNRVHPVTYKSKHLEWSRKTLHEAARNIEIKYGWAHDKGLYGVIEVNGKKVVVPTNDADEATKLRSAKANAFEAWSGRESFETWCKTVPAPVLRKSLDDASLSSWDDLHNLLWRHSIELQFVGGGYRVVTHSDSDDKPVSIALSKAFRFLKPKELEVKFGSFIPFDSTAIVVQREKTYKRDPLKRLLRKEERRAARDELFKRYQIERDEIQGNASFLKAIAKREAMAHWNAGLAKIKDDYASRRQKLQKDTAVPNAHKQLFYAQYKLAREQDVDRLKAECKAIRGKFAEGITPRVSWRSWIEEQAKNGDQAAISALRGMSYREKREQRFSRTNPETGEVEEYEVLEGPDETWAGFDAPEADAEHDPTLVENRELKWSATTNGRIVYTFARKNKFGDLGFIDEGPRVIFGRKEVSDRALRAALEYSKLKWGPTLHLSGGDKEFQERVVRMAVQLGMRVGNPEFHNLQMRAIHEGGPIAVKGSGKNRSIDDEMKKILQRTPGMHFDYAAHNADGQQYNGRIAIVTDSHVIQQVGPDQMIIHELSRLGAIPKSRKPATITYHGGSARVDQQKTRPDLGR